MSGNSRKNLFVSVDASLARLRTSYIDILYMHFWDFTTPTEEIMRGLNDLVSAGKVHYLGVSDTPAWIVAQMNTLARERGWAEFVVYQGRYHVGERDIEREIYPMCQGLGLGLVAWAVLGQGKYTGRFKREIGDTGGERKFVKMSDKDYDISDVVNAVAEEVGRSPSQVCIAWVMKHYQMFPCIGCSKLSHLLDNLEALTLELSDEQINRINAVATIDLGFPHNFIGTSISTCPWLKSGGIIEDK